jgi:hypothetical protein
VISYTTTTFNHIELLDNYQARIPGLIRTSSCHFKKIPA